MTMQKKYVCLLFAFMLSACGVSSGGRTASYDELVFAINTTDRFITQMFIFAFFAVIAYPVLQWVPTSMRKPAVTIYAITLLALFIFVTVYSGGQ